jgi:hypothetical protein
MNAVSNGKLCSGVNKNVGYRYTVIIPTCEKTEYEFDIPTDFGNGGAVFIDGEFVVGSDKDIW